VAQDLPAEQDQSIVPDLSAVQELFAAQDQIAAQDQPELLETAIEPRDLSLDELSLLQELARKNTHQNSGDDQTPPTASADAMLPSPAVAGIVPQSDLGVRDATLPPSVRVDAGRKTGWFASAALSAILASSVTALFLLSGIPALNKPPEKSSAVPAGQVRPQAPAVRTAAAECDPTGAKDPFAQFVFSTPDAMAGNTRLAAELSGADYGWYSLMSLKAKLERHGGPC
jgi:hypothetical protein